MGPLAERMEALRDAQRPGIGRWAGSSQGAAGYTRARREAADQALPRGWLADRPAASAVLRDGVFVVRKGSKARKDEAESLGPFARFTRASLRDSGVLEDQGSSLVFTQDYEFKSATGAAQVVMGGTINGRVAWRLDDGRTFKEWEEAQLDGDDGLEA